MTLERKKEIEKYIQDWFWDKNSHKFAFELAKYLFEFMDNMEESGNLSQSTIRKHISNCWSIGILICQYGYYEVFSPKIFSCPPYNEIEFRRKFSDSKYQIQSYKSTCKKLEKYAIKQGDLSYE